MVSIVAQRIPSLPRPPKSAKMISIDANGFTLEYKLITSLFWNPKGEKKKVRIPFSPSIKDQNEIRQRIIEIAQEAEEKRKRSFPIIFSVPRDLPIWIFLHLTMFFIANPNAIKSISSSTKFSSSMTNLQFILDQIRSRLPNGAASMSWLHQWIIRAHIGEAFLMAIYSYHRGARGSVWLEWVLTHLIVGFTTFFNFNKINPSIPPKNGTGGKSLKH